MNLKEQAYHLRQTDHRPFASLKNGWMNLVKSSAPNMVQIRVANCFLVLTLHKPWII